MRPGQGGKQKEEEGEQIPTGTRPTTQDVEEKAPANSNQPINETGAQGHTQGPIQIIPDLDGDGKVSPVEHLVFWSVVSIVTAVVTWLSM